MGAAKRKPGWFEDDRFWTDLYPSFFPPARWEAAEAEVESLLELVRPTGTRVLDLACGPGRCSMALARRGYQVTGVDRSPFLLARARELSKGLRPKPEWVLKDMRDFERPTTFDLVINLFTSFGYFENPDDDLKVLRRMRNSIKPGGTMVLDMGGKEGIAEIFQPLSVEDLPDGGLLVQRRKILPDWCRIRNHWQIIRAGHVQDYHFEHTLYSGRELHDLLLQAGFAAVQLCGDLSGKPYGVGCRRLVAVAKVPEAIGDPS
jgi:SAM-dependent methyltransferase